MNARNDGYLGIDVLMAPPAKEARGNDRVRYKSDSGFLFLTIDLYHAQGCTSRGVHGWSLPKFSITSLSVATKDRKRFLVTANGVG